MKYRFSINVSIYKVKERSPKYKKTVLIQVDNLVRVAKYARRPNKTVGIFCANVRAEQRHLYLELYTAAQTNSFLLSDQKKIRGKRGGGEGEKTTLQ